MASDRKSTTVIAAPGNCDSPELPPHPSATTYAVNIVLGPVASAHDKSSADEKHASDDDHIQGRRTVTDRPGKELQTQTNLLPMKQLLVVFSGLSIAMLCEKIPLHPRDYWRALLAYSKFTQARCSTKLCTFITSLRFPGIVFSALT